MKADVYEKEAADRRRFGDKPGSWKPGAAQDDLMQKVEAAGTPGPAHKALDALVGNWNAEVKCWAEPGGAPNVSQGKANASWTLNGRFLEEEFHCEMMGKPFSGKTLLGFDNTKQTFNSVWMCDTQTSMFASEGRGENGNKVITLEGKATCAATGRKDIPMKTVLRVISPVRHTLEMFDGSKGNAKTMEIIYTRQ